MNKILLPERSRRLLAARLHSLERPASIDSDQWEDLLRGQVVAVPVATMGALCDLVGYGLLDELRAVAREAA